MGTSGGRKNSAVETLDDVTLKIDRNGADQLHPHELHKQRLVHEQIDWPRLFYPALKKWVTPE
jgi:hypothetical protein